jgi:hypothetical protein
LFDVLIVSIACSATFSLIENTSNLFSLTGTTLTFNGTTADFESNTKSYTAKVKATTGDRDTSVAESVTKLVLTVVFSAMLRLPVEVISVGVSSLRSARLTVMVCTMF